MLDFSTKWPTKFADKVSKRRHNEQTKREGRVAGPNNFLEFCAGVRLTRTGRYRGGKTLSALALLDLFEFIARLPVKVRQVGTIIVRR